MINLSSRFPNHRFDFQDSVFIPQLQTSGTVEAIWHHQGTWQYRITGLSCPSETWWTEDQLETVGCPQCLATLTSLAPACPNCGYLLN